MSNQEIRVFEATIKGAQLLMHNGQLADPLNQWTKRLKEESSRKKKSDDDNLRIAEIEFKGGLYFTEDLGPYIPGHMLDAVLVAGARKKKLGKVFESCVRTTQDGYALTYTGPRTRKDLWEDPRFRDRRGCGVQTSRVIRTRPKFTDWSVTFDVSLFPCELNPNDLEQAIVDAGIYVGIGDFRPRFGTFSLADFKAAKKGKA